MDKSPTGPDYGVFNLSDVFVAALGVPGGRRSEFGKRFEHKASDYMPLCLTLPLP